MINVMGLKKECFGANILRKCKKYLSILLLINIFANIIVYKL